MNPAFAAHVGQPGTANHQSKLSVPEVKAIRSLYFSGVPDRVIAESFGVARGTVNDVATLRTWTHV